MSKLLLSLLLIAPIVSTAQVGVGTATPNAHAALEVASGSKTFILPRLTNDSMNAISNLVQGMTVFNVDSGKFFGYGSRGVLTAIAQMTGGSGYVNFTQNTIGQSFLAPATTTIDAIDFNAGNLSTPSLTLTVTLHGGNTTTGPLLASRTATFAGSGSVITQRRIVFLTPVQLQAGNTYTFLVTPSGANTGMTVSSVIPTNNPYSGGVAFIDGVANPVYDLQFTILRSVTSWHALD